MIADDCKKLFPYLSAHMYNFKIIGCMCPRHQFECKVVLDSELDSKSDSGITNWVEPPP
jgi:hypothetical protein